MRVGRHIAVLALAMLAAASAPASAADLTIDTLLGRWCGSGVDYTFTRARLIVTFHDGRPERTMEIATVKASETWLDVHWKPPAGNTVFTHFSTDRRSMSQAANTHGDMGPVRTFRRC